MAVPLMLMQGMCSEVFWETEKECFDMAMVRVLLYIVPFDIIVFSAGRVYVHRHAQKFPPPSAEASAKLEAGDARAQQPSTIGSAQAHTVQVESVIVDVPKVEAKQASLFRSILNQIWSPPIIGELLGVIIGLTPLQKLLFGSHHPPLAFLMSPVKVLNGAMVPIASFIPALNLGHKVRDLWHGKEKELLKTWLRPVLFILLVKSVIMPMILVSCLILVMDAGLVSSSDGRITQLVLFAETACPTAPVLLIIASSVGHSEAAEVMALALVPQFILFIPISAFVAILAVRTTA